MEVLAEQEQVQSLVLSNGDTSITSSINMQKNSILVPVSIDVDNDAVHRKLISCGPEELDSYLAFSSSTEPPTPDAVSNSTQKNKENNVNLVEPEKSDKVAEYSLLHPDHCKFFAQGYCSRGYNCFYIHSKPSRTFSRPTQQNSEQSFSNGSITCKYFMMGRCRNNACMFSHIFPDAEVSRNNPNHSNTDASTAGTKRTADVTAEATAILDKRSFKKFVRTN